MAKPPADAFLEKFSWPPFDIIFMWLYPVFSPRFFVFFFGGILNGASLRAPHFCCKCNHRTMKAAYNNCPILSGHRVLYPESCILAPGSWLLAPGSWVSEEQASGCGAPLFALACIEVATFCVDFRSSLASSMPFFLHFIFRK